MIDFCPNAPMALDTGMATLPGVPVFWNPNRG